jgi:hypothetical protein
MHAEKETKLDASNEALAEIKHVNAPDREAARIAAVERFRLDDEQRRRPVVQERA